MEINSETAENILSSYNREWSKFIFTLRDNSIDRIFAGYEQPEIMEPTTFAFLLKNREITRSSNYHYHTGLYGYDYNRLPEDTRKELLDISNIIKHIADQRNIPIYEGHYSIDSGFMDIDPDIFVETFALSDYFPDATGERTKHIFEGWMEAVKIFPTTVPIIYNFENINFVDSRPPEESGLIARFNGYYTFSAAKDNLNIKFFGETVPTAKGILGKEITMPLKEKEIPIMKQEILRQLKPLKKLRHSLVEFVYK